MATPTYEQLERVIGEVDGVASVSVGGANGTGKGRLRIRLEPGADADRVAVVVARVLDERFAIVIDPAAIRPVPSEDVAPRPVAVTVPPLDANRVPTPPRATALRAPGPPAGASPPGARPPFGGLEPRHFGVSDAPPVAPPLVDVSDRALGEPEVAAEPETPRAKVHAPAAAPTPARTPEPASEPAPAPAPASEPAAPEPTPEPEPVTTAPAPEPVASQPEPVAPAPEPEVVAPDPTPAPAPVAEPDRVVAADLPRRPLIRDLFVTGDGLDAHVKVLLGLDDLEMIGEVTCPATQSATLRAIARATIAALAGTLGDRARIELESVRREEEGEDQQVIVTVTWLTHSGADRLVGASIVRDDAGHATLRATLDAVNRRVGLLLHDAN